MKIKLTVTNVPDDLVPEAFSGLEMEELGATSEIVDPKAVMTDNAVFGLCVALLAARLWQQWEALRKIYSRNAPAWGVVRRRRAGPDEQPKEYLWNSNALSCCPQWAAHGSSVTLRTGAPSASCSTADGA